MSDADPATSSQESSCSGSFSSCSSSSDGRRETGGVEIEILGYAASLVQCTILTHCTVYSVVYDV